VNGESSTFTIGVIGFERAESRMLQQVVGLSEHRRPTFGPFNKERGGCPHVVVVNADQRCAMDKWNDFRRAHAQRASFAPIFVSGQSSESPRPGPYMLYRPILTTQLFSMLDHVVSEVHGYRPPSPAATQGRLVALTQVEKGPGSKAAAVASELITVGRSLAAGAMESGRSSSAAEGVALMVDESLSARARLHMREVLSPIASRVDFAESGEMALRFIDRYAYSAIFLDALLSDDDDAYEICGRIKRHPLQQGASTVMLTGTASPAERVMGSLAGFDHFLAKPIRRDGINELVGELGRPPGAL
jgi:CheY-like chemotaxis protein